MRFLVQIRLIQVGNAPALGDVEAEELRELFRRLAGDGVAPGAKFRKLLCVPVEGQIAVHHGGHADGADGIERDAELCLHVVPEPCKAGLDAGAHHVHRIGPDAVYQLVFPLKIALSDGDMLLVDQHGLDAGRAQLNAEYGFFQIHHFNLHTRSLTSSSSSSFSGVVSAPMWTNSMSIIRAQSRICPAVTS